MESSRLKYISYAFYLFCVVFPINVKAINKCARALETTFVFRNETFPISDKLISFISDHEIISQRVLDLLMKKVSAFNLSKETFDEQLLLRIVDEVRLEPLKIDKIYKQYYQHIYLRQIELFEQWLKVKSFEMIGIESLFGLDLMFADLGLEFRGELTKPQLESIIAKVKSEYSKSSGISLSANCWYSTLLLYLKTAISSDGVEKPKQLKFASNNFLNLLSSGHIFLPALEIWSNDQMMSQWFSGTTVNLIDLKVNGGSSLHGGLSDLEVVLHDQNHVISTFRAISDVLESNDSHSISPNNHWLSSEVRELAQELENVIVKSLNKLTPSKRSDEEQLDLREGLFVFLHEPQLIESFLQTLKKDDRDWTIDSDNAVQIREKIVSTLERHRSFYRNIKVSTHFQNRLQMLVSTLGIQALNSNLAQRLSR